MKKVLSTIFFLGYVFLSSYSQTLHTYNGEYNAIDHDKPRMYDYGNANYTYYNSDNGRIYHGIFKYKDKEHTLTGNFVNNKQNGKWAYTEKAFYYADKKLHNGTLSISMNFNNGVLEGPINISLTDDKTKAINGFLQASIVDGNIVGNISAKLNEYMGKLDDSVFALPYFGNQIKGEFDSEGWPISEWSISGKTYNLKEIYYEDGSYEVNFINTSTGDPIYEYSTVSYIYDEASSRHYTKEEPSVRPPAMPNLIIDLVNFSIRKIVFRDSEKLQIGHFDFSEEEISQDDPDFEFIKFMD